MRGKDPTSNTVWMISFGDLLTLLVCFFMAMMQFGSNAKSSIILDKTALKGDFGGSKISGTRIADPTSKSSGGARYPTVMNEFVAVESDFPEDSSAVNAFTKERLMSESWVSDAQVEVEACAVGSGSWQVARERALAIRAAVLESGVQPGQVTLRIVGSDCESLKTYSPVIGSVQAVARQIKKNG